jgi:DNA-binding transcriptional LysR family regulator
MNNVHLRSIDLNLMPVFAAVYETGSVAAAAAHLGMTQPAVSHALRRLREAAGDELFVRQARRMKPTPKAESLAPLIRAGLQQFHQVLAGTRPFDPSCSERTFRIAMPDYVEFLLLPGIVRRLVSEAPHVRVQVRRMEALFAPPEAELQRGVLDAAAGFFPDLRGLSSALLQQEILRDKNVLVLRRGHPALKRQMTFESFAALPQAAVIYGSEPQGFIDREMAARGFPRRLAYATPSFLSALRMVAGSDLVACLPAGLVRRFAKEWGLTHRAVPMELPEFVLRLVWPRSAHDDGGHRWLRSLLRVEEQLT